MRGLRLTRMRGIPLAGEALRFAEIGRSQLACSEVATLDRRHSILTGRS